MRGQHQNTLPDNFDQPPPDLTIHPQDWNQTPPVVRREVWTLWINFRSAADGVFSQQLQIIMDVRDINQKQLCEIISVSPSVVSRWLRGRRTRLKGNHTHIPYHLSIVNTIIDELDCDFIEKHKLIRAYALEILWLKGFFDE